MNQSGHTLLEMIVVMVIIGLVLAAVTPDASLMIEAGQAAQCKANQQAIETVAQYRYMIDGEYPSDIDGDDFAGDVVPTCPATGDEYEDGSGYDAATGAASCPTDIDSHNRFE